MGRVVVILQLTVPHGLHLLYTRSYYRCDDFGDICVFLYIKSTEFLLINLLFVFLINWSKFASWTFIHCLKYLLCVPFPLSNIIVVVTAD